MKFMNSGPENLRRAAPRATVIVLVALVCLTAVVPFNAQQPQAPLFTRTEAMIPMRDGVRLYTQVYAPAQATEKLPFLLLRTPYGTGAFDSARLAASLPELAADGYIIVLQDIRGRFKSEGEFVMLRQPRDPEDKKAIDESTDTYDTIEWLLKNVPNQQRARRDGRHELRSVADGDGHARSASGAQSGRSAGLSGRYVDRRRLPPQRRVPVELRLRIRVHDGIVEGDFRPFNSHRSLATLTSGISSSGRCRMSTGSISTTGSQPGTTSSIIPITMLSGSGRPSRRG